MKYGVRTVIDLRFPHEAEERPNLAELDASQLHCVHICLCGGDGEAWKTFYHKGGSKEMWNCAILEDSKAPICAVMRAIAEAPAGGVLFHCVSGKDRTGIIASLLLAIADVEPDAIERDYTISAENLRDAYIGSKTGEEREAELRRVHCPAEQIHNMLDHLDKRYSGVAGYFREIGLSTDEISSLKNRLIETAAN
jgi:protein-tyrosine phosphatase